jgi:hypothetical protein
MRCRLCTVEQLSSSSTACFLVRGLRSLNWQAAAAAVVTCGKQCLAKECAADDQMVEQHMHAVTFNTTTEQQAAVCLH